MEKFSVIVPYFNNQACINRCFREITNQTCKPSQLVLIDDHSDVHSVGALENFWTTDLKSKYGIDAVFIRNELNLGLAASYNIALQCCMNDIVVVMHPDIVLPSIFEFAELIAPFTDDAVHLVGHKSISTDIGYWSSLSIPGKLFIAASESSRAYGFNGQFDAFRKSAADQVGGFNSVKFRTAGEDGDFIRRMTKNGKYVLSNARAQHNHDFRGPMNLKSLLKKGVQYGNAQGALLFNGGSALSAHRELMVVLFLYFSFTKSNLSLVPLVLILLSISRLPVLIYRRDKNSSQFLVSYLIEICRFFSHVFGFFIGAIFRKQRI